MDIQEKFQKGLDLRTYQRIDAEYKVNIFLGYNENGNMSMILTEYGKEEKTTSTRFIDVKLKLREDQKLALSFDLLDGAYSSMFIVFCKDIISACEKAGREKAINTALIRWKFWKEMFGKRRSKLLDNTEIKGLMGELHELRDRFIPQFGCYDAIKSWRGPLLGHKDFETDNTWYEVKTINDGGTQLIISSLEQLESVDVGHLLVVRVSETSETNEKAENLNEMVLQVSDLIGDPELLDEFRTKLNNAGYCYEPEYDSFSLLFIQTDSYRIDECFPRLRRKDVNEAIVNCKYTVSIPGILEHKE